MEPNYRQEHSYMKAKKRVKVMKGFYIHFIIYILVNIFLSGIIIFGLMQSGYDFSDAITNFGFYSTWLFWGIGLFFHFMGVFGFKSLGLGSNWEEKKIKELLEQEDQRRSKF